MTTADDAGPHTQDGPQDVQDGQNPHVTAAPGSSRPVGHALLSGDATQLEDALNVAQDAQDRGGR
jgi:hypothetical protein